jgi:beta-galactosidase
MKSNIFTLVYYFLSLSSLIVQHPVYGIEGVQPGGILGRQHVNLTPDEDYNQSITSSDIRTLKVFGFDNSGDRLIITPHPRAGWRWMASFNVPYNGKRINWFMYDGWLYSSVSMNSNMRRRTFEEDISQRISSNAFHMAFHREQVVENEIVLFVVSPVKQTVFIKFDESLLGTERTISYEMEKLEAKFIHVSIGPEEYTVVTWQPDDVERQIIQLNDGWIFRKGDTAGAEAVTGEFGTWTPISLPHTWNARDIYDTRNIHDGLNIFEMYYRGPGWYRKSFVADNTFIGKNLQLQFLGVNQIADVWLNGSYLGQHVGGYTGFQFDITEIIRFDRENIIAVRVDNSYSYDIPPHTADFNFYGGIYREVQLLAVPSLHISDVFVTTPSVKIDAATVNVTVEIQNTTDIQQKVKTIANIVNPYDEIVQTITGEMIIKPKETELISLSGNSIPYPLLWAPEHPWLYQVYTSIHNADGKVIDQVKTPLGFRWFKFDPDEGFFLNDSAVKLRGVNLHQDYLNQGNAVSLKQKRLDLMYIKEMGANFVRLAHYPHHPYVLSLCDSLGLLVWEEIPFVNTVGRDAFAENTKDMFRQMIMRDKNHPSIILWGVGNEFAMPWLASEDVQVVLRLTQDLHDLAKELDPHRLTIQAHNHIADDRIMDITDVQGRNRYYGWYEDTYHGFASSLDEEKEIYPNWNILISEYGAEGKYGYHVNEPKLFDHSETYQMNFHQAYWEAIEARPWVSGGTIWNMFDFGSHVKIGNIPRINQKGMMTKNRKPKSVYYYYQSKWTDVPMVYIVSQTWIHRTGGANDELPFRVFSNCDTVELFHNGTSLGTQTGTFMWVAQPYPGRNKLKAVGTLQGRVVVDELYFFFHIK